MDSSLLRAFMTVLTFCSVLAPATSKSTDAEAALADARALIEFKRGITIDPYNVLANWNEDAPVTACNWTGITCSKKHPGRVAEIILENATLVGSISPCIANLSFLQYLEVQNNSFSGKIPSSIGQLHRLKLLDLCINHLDGPIPSTIGNLSSVVELYLCFNSFTGKIPQSFTGLTSLEDLDMFTNLLSGNIPPFMGSLSKLNSLDLGSNKFHGFVPGQLGNLSSLQFLALSDNSLVGSIPCTVAKLFYINKLFVFTNDLSGNVPVCLTNITSLTELDLSDNSLHGTLPWSLGRLRSLEALGLGQNSFKGSIPESLLNISSLKTLYLSVNQLQGLLPTWIGSLHKLERLGLAINNFSGRIPESWTNATNLQSLDLTANSLTGTIPCGFSKLKNISVLHLGQNYLTSGFPSSKPTLTIHVLTVLFNLSELVDFQIARNFISGRLPSNMGSFWPKLESLSLQNNFISGKIPASTGNFSSLYYLNLRWNMLDGAIPYELAGMRSIQYLDLSGNRLHGKIPSQISFMKKTLVYLHLSVNKLSGSIHPTIGKLVNLRQLSLRGNRLSGRIPAELGKCQLLESLDLSENQLSGTIPAEVAELRQIIFEFDLSRNHLNGPVPAEIAGLQMAQVINLSSNQLSGNIGLYMQNWLDARHVNLSFNHFNGTIPVSIGNKLRELQSMDLSDNNFIGSVPETLFNLSNLHYLNLSYNDFAGEISCSELRQPSSKLKNLSLMGNPKLCGTCMGLPVCQRSSGHHNPHSQKTQKTLKMVHIGSCSAAVFCLLCLAILLYFKKAGIIRGETMRFPFHRAFLKISVEEVERATNNFSSANLLGEGRHGNVYKGILTSGTTVAIKCFSRLNDRVRDKIFKKECQILQQIRHRNIIKIITVLWSDNVKAIVMPFMSNGSLHYLLHCRHNGSLVPLNLAMRIRILRELACGLTYLHHDSSPQVIHCDIKPENVLLDEDTTVKLSDFGIARLIGNLDASTTSFSSGIRGSLGYIAPEYGTGEAVSEKGDVYSFGVVTLEVITRLKPTHDMFSGDLTLPMFVSMAFEGDTPQQRRHSLQEILQTADAHGGGIDMENEEEMKAVESILMVGLRCTCEDAYRRPTMREVESMLSSIRVADDANHRSFPGNLDQVLELVRFQRPLLGNTANGESSTSS